MNDLIGFFLKSFEPTLNKSHDLFPCDCQCQLNPNDNIDNVNNDNNSTSSNSNSSGSNGGSNGPTAAAATGSSTTIVACVLSHRYVIFYFLFGFTK